MKKLLFIAVWSLLFSFTSTAQRSDYPFQGVAFNQVKLTDSFWMPRVETNRTVTIPVSFRKCEETGRIQNFINAGTHSGKFLTTFPFDDTDIYKIIEGASFSLSVHPDAKSDRYVDSLITLVSKAQEPDGYLYTARTIDPLHPHSWSGKDRWVNESVMSHELYNSGHLFEAASAHYLATGKKDFLRIALKNADLLTQVFGPGKRNDAPGHEIVEMGLVRLYRITLDKKYLDLAKFFIDCRGKKIDKDRSYWQDQAPVADQREAVGHAVRAAYLYSGVADVAALTGNKEYLTAIDSIWENMVSTKFYLNGGIGARSNGERFGDNYELPNKSAYNETCAAIANVYWNYRMFELHGQSKYIDVLERSLYNNVLSGVSLDGKNFFYPNLLAADGSYVRQPWFDCSCCPTNLCRFISSVTGYIYAQKGNSLYVNLFIGSSATIKLNEKQSVRISQQSNYPWDGAIVFSVQPARKGKFALRLRIPGWVNNQPVPSNLYSYLNPATGTYILKVNGADYRTVTQDGYAVIDREWKKGDRVEYNLPMNIQRVTANEKVAADRGLVALERGPILFCLEDKDNAFNVNNFILPDNADLKLSFNKNIFTGTYTIQGEGIAIDPAADKLSLSTRKKIFTAIPYNVWDNRGGATMRVWMPRTVSGFKLSEE
ncbi:MAG: glycoside hydrolase family 127 protein [Bacteroidota bacterium]|nr:glycoside hydrolase family 127 protein [Bacteroidota bacterium]